MPEKINPPAPIQNPITSIEKSLLEGEIVEALRMVYDPELPVNIYALGLIYDIQVDDFKNVHILMTLTSPACPVAGSLPGDVEVRFPRALSSIARPTARQVRQPQPVAP